MKRISKLLLLVTLFACLSQYAWSQASTEGKDFWVANTIICQPPTASRAAFPTIAVSAQKACKVTITDYAGNLLASVNVADGSWTRFGDNTATVDPAEYYLDPSKWYPTTDNIHATDAYKHADKINNYGLHITATENVSVFVIMRTPQYSMDASNALPITALQDEYYLQDFYPDANDVAKPVTMTTILATENNTKVVITPRGNTYGKNNNGTPYSITLNQGQTYYLISDVNSQLAGTHIVAQEGKKIAVYVGSPVTRLPGGVAARDGLFEQMMPIVYWGTQFIATRSLQKDGNIIGITATVNGTELKIDGYTQTFLNEGDTYYILLQGAADPYNKNLAKITCHIDQVITADEAYIETSCPCAVISYDTGNSFAGATGSEIVNGQGDPSSVWISPIQQKINRITFGACYTQKTKAHFLNIVTETVTCANTTLTAYIGQSAIDWSSKLSWTVVPGNPTYSYARVQIGNDTEDINVFTLENSKGFIAHVYGNGDDESYAYSAGSAAVEQGVIMDGETFTNGYRSDTKFCIGTEFIFDAKVGTDEITRVDWNFGDGTTQYNGEPVTTHTYNTPGWYDATAKLYGHQACAEESEQDLGTVSFTFRVWRHDTVIVAPTKKCLTPEEQADTIRVKGQEYLDYLLANPSMAILNPDAPCYEDRQLSVVTYGLETTLEKEEEGRDSVYVNEQWYYADKDPKLPADGIIEWIEEKANRYNCDRHVTCHAKIITCLDIDIQQTQLHTCLGENLLVNYTKYKGDIDGKAVLTIAELPSYRKEIDIPQANISGTIDLPIADLKDPGYYTGIITIHDVNCSDQTLEFTIPIVVYYPADIFVQKFNNVLAVYAPGNGGNKGYTFTGYQWYRNGEAIQDATGAVYHSENPLEGIYYVVLTNSQNVTLPSCEQEVYGKSYMPSQAPAAQKKIVNQRICIVIDNRAYDVYGQRVE